MPADRLVAVLYVAGGSRVQAGRGGAEGGPGSGGAPAGVPTTVLALQSCRPARPFQGPLFAAIVEAARSARYPLGVADPTASIGEPAVLGLVVPLRWLGRGAAATWPTDPVVVSDHVDLSLRGPLVGCWPPDRRRTFPSMSAVYVPDTAARLLAGGVLPACGVTPAGRDSSPGRAAPAGRSSTSGVRQCHPAKSSSPPDPAVYSRLAVAGVADARRLSVWEQRQARAAGLIAAADCLVAPVVIAALFGLVVAAVGVPGDESQSHGRRQVPPGGGCRARTRPWSTNEGEP